MINHLVDTSAWIEYFKGNQKYAFLKELIYTNTICINDIILTELLPSMIHKKEKALSKLITHIRKYSLLIDWQEIRNFQVLNLKQGNNHIGISDIIIAQNCMQNQLKLITNDQHFLAMSKYVPLELYK